MWKLQPCPDTWHSLVSLNLNRAQQLSMSETGKCCLFDCFYGHEGYNISFKIHSLIYEWYGLCSKEKREEETQNRRPTVQNGQILFCCPKLSNLIASLDIHLSALGLFVICEGRLGPRGPKWLSSGQKPLICWSSSCSIFRALNDFFYLLKDLKEWGKRKKSMVQV